MNSLASPNEIEFVHQENIRAKRQAKSNVINCASICDETPKQTTEPIPLTKEQALALYVDAKLTVGQYKLITKIAKLSNADIFPCYDDILKAKNDCYPVELDITEASASVSLKNLLSHMVHRIRRIPGVISKD